MKFLEKGITLALESGVNMDRGWEEAATALMYVGSCWARRLMCGCICLTPRQPFLTPQIAVPRHSVGVVIGRNGEMIKKIQSDAGVKIQFKPGERDYTTGSKMIPTSCARSSVVHEGTPNTHAHKCLLSRWTTVLLPVLP